MTAVAGLVLYRGKEYGDFLAAAMGLTVGAALVVTVQPSRFVSVRWLRLAPRRTVRWSAALVACYVLIGLAGQGMGQAALRRGMESLEQGDYAAMYHTIDRTNRVSVALKPFTFYLDDFSGRLKRESQSIFARGGQRLEQGAWKDAEYCYRTALTAEPDRAQAWGDLGTAVYMQNRFDEAGLCYLRVLETDPNDLIALYHLAMTRIHQRQFDAATDLVERILSIDSDGTCYRLIRENPEFVPMEDVERYRQAMALYERMNVSGP
jgi:tetratricopeptide (TPR) repeat protein